MADQAFDGIYARARAGDPDARDHLVRSLWPRLDGYVTRHMGAGMRRLHAPEDLAQQAMLAFVTRLDSFPAQLDETTLLRYLLRIAKWTIAEVSSRRRLTLGESACSRLDPVQPTPTTGPVTQADERAQVERVLSRLRPDYAEVLRRLLLEGRTADEVARELDLQPATVRKRLERARREFARRLPGHQPPARGS